MGGPDQLETRTGIPTPETEPPFSVSCFKTYKLLLYMGTYVESSREHVKTTLATRIKYEVAWIMFQ